MICRIEIQLIAQQQMNFFVDIDVADALALVEVELEEVKLFTGSINVGMEPGLRVVLFGFAIIIFIS